MRTGSKQVTALDHSSEKRHASPPKLAGSLHDRILSEVKAKIMSGEWAPGHRLPFETELSASYGCSRMTVNKVLTQLAAAGLIERRRKAGSFVTRPSSQSAVLKIQDIEAEVTALGVPYSFKMIFKKTRAMSQTDQDKIDLPVGTPILELICYHFAGVLPFCLEQRIINLRAVPEVARESFSLLPPGTWLRQRVPWITAEHQIRATGADAAATAAFQIAKGAPCLVVERRTWGVDQPVTFVTLTYPANAHRLVARFTPSAAGNGASALASRET